MAVSEESQPAALARVPTVAVEELLDQPRRALVVDLRTPDEFDEDHLPGAVNLPLLDNAGRALVGRHYARVSPQAGFEQGQALIEAGIGELVARVEELTGWKSKVADPVAIVRRESFEGIEALDQRVAPLPPGPLSEGAVVLHCWRGGLRSRSVVALLRSLGLERAVGLFGGYRSYRACVRGELDRRILDKTFVLRGLTGVGKSLVLREIARLRPNFTLDLEDCAQHRSSLLGMVGMRPRSQKAFESAVALGLRGRSSGPLVLEGESRRVGDAIIPAALWTALDEGTNILLEAGRERRIEVLARDYLARPEALPKLREQLIAVEERMTGTHDLKGLLDQGKIEELVDLLLLAYYDPLYSHSERGRRYLFRVDSSDPKAAAEAIVTFIEASPNP